MKYEEAPYRRRGSEPRVCPRCGTEAELADVVKYGFGVTYYYSCKKCGYKWYWDTRSAWEARH